MKILFKKNIFLIFILNVIFNLIFKVGTIRISIQSNHMKPEICFNKMIEKGESINLSYVITGGYYLDKCNCYLYDPSNKIIFDHYDATSGKLENFEINNTGIYKLCFKPLTDSKMYLTLDFHTIFELGNTREIAKDSKKYFRRKIYL
jgi:hypothetical protein